MTKKVRDSKAFVLSLALFGALAGTLSFTGSASANTDCYTAMQSAMAAALSKGDIATASKAQGMCSSPCGSISSFYINYSSYLESSYLENMILDAYETCIAAQSGAGNGDNQNPTPVTSGKFTTVVAPKILGSLRVGQTLKIKSGSWSRGAEVFNRDWWLCTKSYKKDAFKVAPDSVEYLSIMADGCSKAPIGKGPTLKIESKYRGKYISLCVWMGNDDYWGGYCTKTVARVTG